MFNDHGMSSFDNTKFFWINMIIEINTYANVSTHESCDIKFSIKFRVKIPGQVTLIIFTHSCQHKLIKCVL